MHNFFKFRLFLLCVIFINCNLAIAAKKVIKIGSGAILKGYYPIGLKLCDFITESNSDIECYVLPTQGSVDNLRLLREGKIDFALTQSNIALDAFEGSGYFKKEKPMKELRQILTLHDEAFTVIAKDENKIKVFEDINGKKISSGNSSSASGLTYKLLRQFYNFTKEPIEVELSDEAYANELCNNNIDAVILMVGHPNALVAHIAANCDVDFVHIERNQIDKFIENNKSFHISYLRKEFYHDIADDQATVAVSAILVATNKVDHNLLKNFMNYFHNNMHKFKQANPVLYDLDNQHFTSNFILPNQDIFKH